MTRGFLTPLQRFSGRGKKAFEDFSNGRDWQGFNWMIPSDVVLVPGYLFSTALLPSLYDFFVGCIIAGCWAKTLGVHVDGSSIWLTPPLSAVKSSIESSFASFCERSSLLVVTLWWAPPPSLCTFLCGSALLPGGGVRPRGCFFFEENCYDVFAVIICWYGWVSMRCVRVNLLIVFKYECN